MVIESEIVDGDPLLARARVAMVFVDPATSRPLAPPPDVRERLLAAPGAVIDPDLVEGVEHELAHRRR